MTEKSKKILITKESHETFRLSIYSGDRAFGHCRECGREVEIVTLEYAAWLTRLGVRNILRQVDEETVHATETEGGMILICRDSLAVPKADMEKTEIAVAQKGVKK